MKKIQKMLSACVLLAAGTVIGAFTSTAVLASSSEHPLADVEIMQDEASIKRGAMIYYNTCRLCHSMKYIRYQNLAEIGFSDKEINELRGDKLKSAKFTSTTTDVSNNDLFGLVPPDLSVMAKARKNGPQYIYTLLTSYYEKSENVYDNKFFPNIKMPDIFAYSVALSEAEKTEVTEKAKDVSSFLLWASDPRAQERKTLGVYVIAYLIILSLMFYFVMKRVWSRLDD